MSDNGNNRQDAAQSAGGSSEEGRRFAAVIGAGPAGLFAARELAERGVKVVIFNRDIKPGGLAEYGIYPSKLKMKEGLRNQFRQILGHNGIQYFGNVLVGTHGDLTLADLRGLGFQAMLVTVGAQSTKRLGIPGEELAGVFHAKDIVYHYNVLPPFSESTYQIGKRVAVVGVGNVMMDVAHWLIEEAGADEVIAVARRGPAEVKFDRKELEAVAGYIDMPTLERELERVRPVMEAIGQTPEQLRNMITEAQKKAAPTKAAGMLWMRFLSSPSQIIGNLQGQAVALEVEENSLLLTSDGESKAKGTGIRTQIPIDSVIFAIGDVVDPALGLPVEWGAFVNAPQPRYPVEGNSYEVFDPITGQAVPDLFLAGWARKPSVGLVGVARKDAVNAAQAVVEYLETVEPIQEDIIDRVRSRLAAFSHPVVEKSALARLDNLERERAKAMNREWFKFGSNREMLEALGLATPL